MKSLLSGGLLGVLFVAATAGPAASFCCPFYCEDCNLVSEGQLNWVVMDRLHGHVQLIPNVRLTGDARDFALVVPTPSLPELTPVSKEIWEQARQLTAPLSSNRYDYTSGCGCTHAVYDVPASVDDGGVIVHNQLSVGAFIATIISSGSPAALVTWLREKNFTVTPRDSGIVAELATQGWFFTAMKLNPESPEAQVPQYGWDTNVNPVQFRYAATVLEIPMSFMGINRGYRLPMVFFVLDDHRMRLDGFTTTYANRISPAEYDHMQAAYPDLSRYLRAGRYLTRLDHTFTQNEEMAGTRTLKPARSDEEFRRVSGSTLSNIPADWLFLGFVPWAARRFNRRRNR